MKGLQLNHLSFKTRGHALFTDLSAHFAQGKLIALAGANGCGKSTLLSILAGLNQPQQGKVLFNEQNIYEHTFKPSIGYLPNIPCLYPHLTIAENIQWLLSLQLCIAPKVKAARFMAQYKIEHLKDKLFGKISDGQKKRIHLLVSNMHEPELLILDEPCSLLDPAQRREVWTLLENWRHPNKVILFSTHHVSEITALCDEIFFLHDGLLHVEKHATANKVPCL